MKTLLLFCLLIVGACNFGNAQTAFIKSPDNPVLTSSYGNYGDWDSFRASNPTVVQVGDTLKMYFTVNDTAEIAGYCFLPDSPYTSIEPHRQIAMAWSIIDSNKWNRDTMGPVLTPGPDRWDSLGVETATVVYDSLADDSVKYKMWYMGYGTDLCDPNSNWQVGYAYSANGIDWTKYSGNPVMSSFENGGPANRTDRAIQGPEVIVDYGDADYLRYKMWYTSIDHESAPGEEYGISYAWSGDGITWTKYANNPVMLSKGLSSWEPKIKDVCVRKIDGDYHMWYTGFSHPEKGQIGYAWSDHGLTWIKDATNPILKKGDLGCSFDSLHVQSPTVIYRDSTFHLWYSGSNADTACSGFNNGINAIGYAVSPQNGFDNSISLRVDDEPTIRVFPNPFTNELRFEYTGSGSLEIEIRDILGRQVTQLQKIESGMDGNTVSLNTAKLSSGLYLYVWSVDGSFRGSGKLMKR